MRGYLCLVLVCLLSWGAHAQSDNEDDGSEAYAENIRRAMANISVAEDDVQLQDKGVPGFDCDLDANEPADIHTLSPRFVDVVAAMGDSVTAGFGAAKKLLGLTTQYRGLSWSIGGDKNLDEIATLPNVLRTFNSDLKGFSTGTGKPTAPNAKLNVAISGAKCNGMLGQAQDLVTKLSDMGHDDEDWKVVTMWIGGNDFCAITSNSETPAQLATKYVEEVKKALDYLHDNLRRTFVNVALMIDVSKLHRVTGLECTAVHLFACSSILNADLRVKVTETVRLYNEYLQVLVDNGGTYERDDFTVVLQPFFSHTPIPETDSGSADKSYFALDCFHFSQKGHAVGAIYLWNNMFEQVGKKTDEIDWDNQQPLTCPVDYPYFSTYKNSLSRGNGGVQSANADGGQVQSANADDDQSGNSNDKSSTNLVAILVGTGVGVFLVAMAATVVAMVAIRRRNKRATGPNEKMLLLSFKG